MAVRYLRETEAGTKEPEYEKKRTLPEYLRQLRVSSHYRQNFVAAKLNISRQTYSHYETGRIRPPARALYGLAKLYEVPVESLLSCMISGWSNVESAVGKPENRPEYKEYESEDKDCQERKLLSGFRNLSEKDRQDILSIIEMKSSYCAKTAR